MTDVAPFLALFDLYQAQDTAEVWSVHISDQVMNPSTRRQLGRGRGQTKSGDRCNRMQGSIELAGSRGETGRAWPWWAGAKWEGHGS